MRRFRQGDAPVILYSVNGVKLYDFGLNRIIEADDEDLCNLLLAMGAVEIPPEVSPVPQDLTEVGERINALAGRVTIVEGRSDIRSIGAGLALSGTGELAATGGGSGSGGPASWDDIGDKPSFAAVATSGSYNDLIDKPPSGGGDAVLTATLTASKTVGGISSGKRYAASTPLESLFRDMLNPVEAPAFTPPSATISASGGLLVEEGTTASKTLTVAFSQGKIDPAYGTSGYRSGPATGYSLNGGASQSGNTFTVTVSESNKTFAATVAYAAGEQPKDSAGADWGEPLAAGSVNTNTLTFEIVAALWSNAASIAQIAKETLISKSVKQKQFNFPPQTAANPEVFDVPASWTVTAVELLNTLNNQWVDDTSEFDVSDATHGAIAYKRYTYNGGDATGARSIRIKWN